MIFEYDDEFVISCLEQEKIEKIEAEKYDFVLNKLKVQDKFYIKKLTVALVYMEIARLNLESDGMKTKYDIYKAEFEHFLNLAKNNKSGVFNINTARG